MSFRRDRFRELREKFGSRDKFAGAIKMTSTSVANWETANADIMSNSLAVSAEILGTTVAYLMDEIDDPSPDALNLIRDYQKRLIDIEATPAQAHVDHQRRDELDLSDKDLLERIRLSNRNLKKIEEQEALEKYQEEARRRKLGIN